MSSMASVRAGRFEVEVEQTVAAGDHETTIVRVLRDLLEFPDERLEAMRSGPEWSALVATAPT